MSSDQTRKCSQCGQEVPADARECPHCGQAQGMGIITMSVGTPPPPPMPIAPPPPPPKLEDLPPPVVPLEEAARLPEPVASENLAPAAPPAALQGVLLPTGVESHKTFSFSSSVVRVSRSGEAAQVQLDGAVQLSLPQEVVDPERRLTADQYARLMEAWSRALSAEMKRTMQGGEGPDLGDFAERVPLPFDAVAWGVLSPEEQAAMTRRAQTAVEGLFSAVRQAAEGTGAADALVTMDVPMPVMHRALHVEMKGGKRQVGCTALLALIGLAALAAMLAVLVR